MTVNNAINAVQAGGTVNVRAGTYSELGIVTTCFPISKNMTLQAYNGESVTLTYPVGNPPLTAAGEYGRIMRLTNANVTVDGFTIVGTHDEGDSVSQDDDVSIYVDANAQGTIQNCTFSKWGHAAVKCGNIGGALTVQNNTFQAGGFATIDHHIYATGDYRTNILTISDNSFTGSTGWGIQLYSYVYGAVISGNTINANQGGILVTGESHTITGNTITNNTGGHGIDFFHYGLISLTVTGNTVSGNTDYDLFLDAGVGEGFTNCTISGNTGTQNW